MGLLGSVGKWKEMSSAVEILCQSGACSLVQHRRFCRRHQLNRFANEGPVESGKDAISGKRKGMSEF